MAKNEENGVWRTVGGRRIFIKDGQDLATAMVESGKFKNLRSDYRKAKEEMSKKEAPEGEKFRQTLEESKVKTFADEIKEKEKINPATGKPIHKLGQTNETDEKIDLDNYKPGNYFEKHEAERLEIAKDIAKELNPSLKSASEERLEREAKRLLEYNDGEVLEKGETTYTNQKGELERSTDSLKKWRDELKKSSESETFTSQSTNPFYADKEYSKDDLKKMEENGVKPMNNTYSGNGWKGVNVDKNLSTKEQAKAITDEMKKQYPDVKISRKSDIYSGGSSIDFNIMSSDKDLYISDKDIDKFGSEQLFNTDITRGYGFERWANDNVPSYKTEHTYSVDDVKKYAKETLNNIKNHEEQNVRGNEWYLSDYGKKVVSELNKQANSYTYDDSDAMTDYFSHGTYMNVSIGKWNKPYQVNETKSTKSNSITNSLQQKAYKKYLKEHPNSKMTFEEFMK